MEALSNGNLRFLMYNYILFYYRDFIQLCKSNIRPTVFVYEMFTDIRLLTEILKASITK